MHRNTSAVHAGQRNKTNIGVVNPIEPSSAFHYIDEGDQFYPRYFNTPNQSILIDKLRRLENAESGLFFSSGMAAISTTLLALLKPGDHVVLLSGLYGGTHSFVMNELKEYNIDFTFAAGDVSSLLDAANDRTKLIFVESPANPLLDVIDLRSLANGAKKRNLLTAIDNTFASPINQTPIDLGIDLSLHSGTKYLGGHSDLCFGATVGSASLIEKITRKAIHLGGSLNALTCYLIERSLKTLAVRVDRQNDNAQQVAEFLSTHPAVRSVNYPGLPDHHSHDIAKDQMHGYGGMLSFDLAGSAPTQQFLAELDLITAAMSLGGVESTATMPVFTSHRLMPAEERAKLGISDRLIRLSIGIEHAPDLIADLDQALTKSQSPKSQMQIQSTSN